jgi:SAM-dependent methyltransferase
MTSASDESPTDESPTTYELQERLALKHGDIAKAGWGVRRRVRFGYFTPDDYCEALVARYVQTETQWLDVGGGASVFPHNAPLAKELSARCSLLVGVDPSDNIHANPFVRERVQCLIEDYQTDHRFDLATFRMAAEHIADPPKVIAALNRLLAPGGRVVIYTVNRRSPISLAARFTPFGLHHPLKRLLWGGEEKDTFPVVYRMNTRRDLRRIFESGGFREQLFLYLDDLATFSQMKALNWVELCAWRTLHKIGLRYPENCLLGVYRKGM